MTEIVLDKVCRRFADGTVAVRDASVTIGDGEFFILVGPSGCGKSTLLNLIVGLDRPSSGEIRIDGRRVNEVDARKRNMAMVFQSYAIYPHMTVRENLAFPLTVAGQDRAQIRERVERAARVLELEALLDRRPASLSGGQRQRVAMGRAIVREPAAFLLDEPLSNLDARLRVQMRTEIARVQKRLGTTTVYVTHDQSEAMTLGDRVAVMREGRLLQIGTPRALYRMPDNLFVAGFIGLPGMNFLPARSTGASLELPFGRLEPKGGLATFLAANPGPLIAGIRPEHLYDATPGAREGFEFEAVVDVLEWMGADLYLHFGVDQDAARRLGELRPAVDAETNRQPVSLVARLGPDSRAAESQSIRLGFDPADLYLFDPDSGARLWPEAD